MRSVQQGLKEQRFAVSITKLCRWFGWRATQRTTSPLSTLRRVPEPLLLCPDNGLVFTDHDYTHLVHSYGLKQEFVMPHCPQQNGMVERVIQTLKEQCMHRHRFESQSHALRVIGDGIVFYDQQCPH